MYTGKQVMGVVSEGLECFGGVGYLEDSGIPTILRDAQVLPIWEGTTNVLSMDVIRVLAHTKGAALEAFKRAVTQRLSALQTASAQMPAARSEPLKAAAQAIQKAFDGLGMSHVYT